MRQYMFQSDRGDGHPGSRLMMTCGGDGDKIVTLEQAEGMRRSPSVQQISNRVHTKRSIKSIFVVGLDTGLRHSCDDVAFVDECGGT